jgi:hypothetical protein
LCLQLGLVRSLLQTTSLDCCLAWCLVGGRRLYVARQGVCHDPYSAFRRAQLKAAPG